MSSFDTTTKAASLVPIIAAIYFTCRGFIGLGMTVELVIILTTLFAALSWMLSQALLRFLEVRHNKPMAGAIMVLGAAFLATEACFAHLGLEWLLKQGQGVHAHPALVWFFSVALSVTNVLAKWAFLGDPGERKAVKAINYSGAENVVAIDPKVEKQMAEIGERVRSAT
ncbi:MAG: hypothetical protein AAFQ22_00480 [Pseudomonadota bacterium]